jgi:hypothetical protein
MLAMSRHLREPGRTIRASRVRPCGVGNHASPLSRLRDSVYAEEPLLCRVELASSEGAPGVKNARE